MRYIILVMATDATELRPTSSGWRIRFGGKERELVPAKTRPRPN